MGSGNTGTGRGGRTTSTKHLIGDRRRSERINRFLRLTEIGRRFGKRGVEEDDPRGLWAEIVR
jgi:hypothetical protein